MANQEAFPEGNNKHENEQTPEGILLVLQEAIEQGKEVNLTVLNSDGSLNEGSALPLAIDGKYLDIEADGYGMSIELDKIKRAE